MPTYRNDGTRAVFVINNSGNTVRVDPGHWIQTHFILTETFWTETAATPHWNPVLNLSSPVGDAVTPADVAIVAGAKTLRIHNRSGQNITVFFRATTNTPGLLLPSGTDYIIGDDHLDAKVDKLVFTFGGVVASGVTVIQTTGEESRLSLAF